MWVVFRITKEIEVEVCNSTPEYKDKVALSYADGMIGVLPVFETWKAANEYADGAAVHEISLS